MRSDPGQSSPDQLHRILRGVSGAAARLFRSKNWHEDVEQFLADLATAATLDRAGFWQNPQIEQNEDHQPFVCEWTQPAVPPSSSLPDAARLVSSRSPITTDAERLANGEVVSLGQSTDLRSQFLDLRGVRHQLLVPVFVHRDWWGVLSLESSRLEPTWAPNEIESFELGAAIFGAAIDRREVESALRRSEELYRGLFENADDFVYTHDLQGNYTSMNQAGAALTGYSVDELMRMGSADLVAPEYLDLARKMTRLKVLGKADTTTYEIEIVTKSGDRLTADVSSRVVEENGAPVAVQGIARDITEKKRIEARLRQAQKMEAIGKLAGGVAHDFNNLLTVINGNCDQLLARSAQSERAKSELEDIRAAGYQAADLTRQLLAFSSQQVMMPRILDLNSVVTKIERMLRRLIGEDIELEADLSPEIGMIRADPGQVEQVIMNLIINARDVMPKGGVVKIETRQVELDSSELEPGTYVRLRVSDTGEGIDQATLGRLFEPFFTTKELGKGTGLGLSTVYGIVHQCGGEIQATSKIGQGSTFDVHLPCVESPPAEDRPPVEMPEVTSGHEIILLVEDEEMVRSLTRRVLIDQGYQVLVAPTPREALDIVHPGVDLLITDVVMPGMSGPDLAERIGPTLSQRRVIFMSGYTESFIGRHGLLDTRTRFLAKPFTPDQLLTEVRAALDAEDLQFPEA